MKKLFIMFLFLIFFLLLLSFENIKGEVSRGSWSDNFEDDSKLEYLENITLGENAKLNITKSEYGWLTSIPIKCNPFKSNWENIQVNKIDLEENVCLELSVLDNNTNKPIENFNNFKENKIDISNLDAFNFPVIKLRVDFFGNETSSPILNKYEISWYSINDWNDTFKDNSLVENSDNLTIHDGDVSLSLVNPIYEDDFNDNSINKNLWSWSGSVGEFGNLWLQQWSSSWVKSKINFDMNSYILEYKWKAEYNWREAKIGIIMEEDNEILLDGPNDNLEVKINGIKKTYDIDVEVNKWHRWKFVKEGKKFNIYLDDILSYTLEEGNYPSNDKLENAQFYIKSGENQNLWVDDFKLNPINYIFYKSQNLISKEITIPIQSDWAKILINKTEYPSNIIGISLLDANTNKTIPNFENLSVFEIDISGINPQTYRKFKLKAQYEGNESSTPILHDWKVTWKLLPRVRLITLPLTTYTNEEIHFDGSASFDILGDNIEIYKFDFGDGNKTDWIENKTITHKYTNCGVYYVCLKIKNSSDVESKWSEKLKITIENLKPSTLSLDFSQNKIMRTETLIIYSNGSDVETIENDLNCEIQYKASTGEWNFLEVIYNSDHWGANFKPNKSAELGFYNFRVKFTDKNGANSSWFNKQDVVEVLNKDPNANIENISPNPANEGENITFNGNCNDDDGTVNAYKWQSNINGFLSDKKSFILSNLSIGIHTISFTVKDDNDLWSKKVSTNLRINGILKVRIDDIIPNPAKKGVQITFSGTGADDSSIIKYYWLSDMDGFLSYEKSFSLNNLSIGTHTIYFKAQDDNGIWSEEVLVKLIIKDIKEKDNNFKFNMPIIIISLLGIFLVCILGFIIYRKRSSNSQALQTPQTPLAPGQFQQSTLGDKQVPIFQQSQINMTSQPIQSSQKIEKLVYEQKKVGPGKNICPKCSAKVPEWCDFCIECGEKIDLNMEVKS